jgi:hypothetical protein
MKSNVKQFACCILFMSFSCLTSQNLYVNPLPQETIRFGVKYQRPYFTQDAAVEMKTMSGMYDILMNMPLIHNFNLEFDVPMIVQAYDDRSNGSGLGNVYLGLHSRPDSLDNMYTSASFGIFVPTIKSSISALNYLGVFTAYQEPQKATNDMLTLYANYICLMSENHGKYIGFELGPQIYIPIKSSAGTGDLYAHYGLCAGYAISNVILTAELLGLAGVTSSYNTFSERFDHSLALAVTLETSHWCPTLFYQIVIDNQTSQILNGILGINLNLGYRNRK